MAGVTLNAGRTADAELRRAECDDLRRLATDLIFHSAAMWDAGERVKCAARSMADAEASGNQQDVRRYESQWRAAREDSQAADAGARSAVADLRLSHPSVAGKAERLWRASRVPDACGSTANTTRREAEARFASRVWARLEVLEA